MENNNFLEKFIEQEQENEIFSSEEFLSLFKAYTRAEKNKKKSQVSEQNYKDEKVVICDEPIKFIKKLNLASTIDESNKIFEDIKQQFKVVNLKEVPKNNIWFNKTDRGINLRPGIINNEKSRVDAITLADETVHGVVVGRTGGGKSVFLNNLIFNMMHEYSPWELDLYLADFKKVELSRYVSGKYKAPHVKACAATSEIKYVISLFDYLVQCMRAREKLFAKLGVTKIKDFRDRYKVVLPRVLVVVDEFQQLFLEATSKESNKIDELLTSITKLGRATGFHLLFASQEMSGTLSGKVFANFKAKFALPCDNSVSSQVLGNGDAEQLIIGEVLVNTKTGKRDENIKYRVPFLSDEAKGNNKNLFEDYLKNLVGVAENYNFEKIQKYYREEYAQSKEILLKLKNKEKYKEQVKSIKNLNENVVDSILLGEPVVYNDKKVDYETFFLEKGLNKNIGVFCNSIEDLVYMQNLFVWNFKYRDDEYTHHLLQGNEVIKKIFDINDTGINFIEIQNLEYISNFINDKKKLFSDDGILSLLFESDKYMTFIKNNEVILQDTCLKYLGDKTKFDKNWRYWSEEQSNSIENYLKRIESDDKKVKEIKKSKMINAMLKILSKLEKEPTLKEVINENTFNIGILKNIISNLFNKFYQDLEYEKIEGLTNGTIKMLTKIIVESNLEEKLKTKDKIDFIWISGAENIDGLEKSIIKEMKNCIKFNMIFIIFCNDDEGIRECLKRCDYRFLNYPNDKPYTRYQMSFTKKSYDSRAIDFKIISLNEERSFKKFDFEFKNYVPPKIDFEEIGFSEED